MSRTTEGQSGGLNRAGLITNGSASPIMHTAKSTGNRGGKGISSTNRSSIAPQALQIGYGL